MTVRVELPDSMDDGPLTVLTGLVLGALDLADVKVTSCDAWAETKGD